MALTFESDYVILTKELAQDIFHVQVNTFF